MIRQKKNAFWEKFLREQGNRHPWDIVRIAKDPFQELGNLRDLTDKDGNTWTLDMDKCQAFQPHLISSYLF